MAKMDDFFETEEFIKIERNILVKNNEITAVYSGTFDSPTSGHLQVIKKACDMFDKLIIVIATGDGKSPMFSPSERQKLLEDTIPHQLNGKIEVKLLPKGIYTVSYAKKLGANVIIRGMRNGIDFEYEHNPIKITLQKRIISKIMLSKWKKNTETFLIKTN